MPFEILISEARIPKGLRWKLRQLLKVYEKSRINKVTEDLLCLNFYNMNPTPPVYI